MGCGASTVASIVAEIEASPHQHEDITVTCWTSPSYFPELSPGGGDFAVPSLADKEDLGICMSGGGLRAATLSLGFLRALHNLGILKKARYIAGTSGATWTLSALSFGKYPSLDEFLGTYVPPHEFSLSDLKDNDEMTLVGQDSKTFGSALTSSKMLAIFTKDLIGDLFQLGWTQERARAWTTAVAKSFLEPFGVGDAANSATTVLGTGVAAKMKSEAFMRSLGLENVYTCDTSLLPFPILTECILRSKDPRSRFIPHEWNPLYCGVPSAITDSSGVKFGAGYIESHARNSVYQKVLGKPDEANGGQVKLSVKVMGSSPLALATGISSGYIPYKLQLKNETASKLAGTDTVNTFDFPPFGTWSNKEEVEMADGGGCDFIALYPLLRRGVKKVIAYVSTSTPPDCDWAKEDNQLLAGYWGRWGGKVSEGDSLENYNASRQVFKSEAWDEFHGGLKAQYAAGGAVFYRGTWEVLKNDYLNIPGGYEVDLFVIVNAPSSVWESKLPSNVKQHLDEERSNKVTKQALKPFINAGVGHCPMIDTMIMAYDPSLVMMTSNLAAWSTIEAIKQSHPS